MDRRSILKQTLGVVGVVSLTGCFGDQGSGTETPAPTDRPASPTETASPNTQTATPTPDLGQSPSDSSSTPTQTQAVVTLNDQYQSYYQYDFTEGASYTYEFNLSDNNFDVTLEVLSVEEADDGSEITTLQQSSTWEPTPGQEGMGGQVSGTNPVNVLRNETVSIFPRLRWVQQYVTLDPFEPGAEFRVEQSRLGTPTVIDIAVGDQQIKNGVECTKYVLRTTYLDRDQTSDEIVYATEGFPFAVSYTQGLGTDNPEVRQLVDTNQRSL